MAVSRRPSSRPRASDAGDLVLALATVGVLTVVFVRAGVTHSTTVALGFLLIVLVVATVSTRAVAVSASVLAFVCFNFFFLPPVGTFAIVDPENWVALFTLLAVSMVASHLSSQVRQRAQEAMASRDELARLFEEREKLLEERKEAELVRRGAALKSALLASLSHDLKTPLTAVTVAANNLNAGWLTDEQRREQAEIVRVELQRLNRLFQDVVDMARIETNAVEAEREWVDPEEIVEAAVQQAEHALVGHDVTIDRTGPKLFVRVDPRLTSAALAHLVENAGQYSPPGSTITVGITTIDGELRVAVRDRGPGVPPRDLEHVFERSFRGQSAGRHRFGTGMGLAISRGLLQAQGGRVWAENNPDGGAVFTLAVSAESRPAAVLEVDA